VDKRPYQYREKYLKKMFRAKLRPVIYLGTGATWPTVQACAQDLGVSSNKVYTECLQDGNFAFFPEYFWSQDGGLSPGALDHYQDVFRNIERGLAWMDPRAQDGPPVFGLTPEEAEEEDPKERKPRTGRPVIDLTDRKFYPSIRAFARDLGVAHVTVLEALSRGKTFRGHRLLF
jgi:hypothetical protein